MLLEFSIFTGNNIEWNKFISKFDNLTMYQIYEWGEFKSRHGWKVLRLIGLYEGNAISFTQMLFKKKFGINLVWIPGGPVGNIEPWFSSIQNFISSYFGYFSYCRINAGYSIDKRIVNKIKKYKWKKPLVKLSSEMTMLLELNSNSYNLKKKLSKKWKYGLNRSAKNKLTLKNIKQPNRFIKNSSGPRIPNQHIHRTFLKMHRRSSH